MDKTSMREYVTDLETRIDLALRRWEKLVPRYENGEVVTFLWKFGNCFITLDIFWQDGKEAIQVDCKMPRSSRRDVWSDLNEACAVNVMDRVGNFAQIVEGNYHREAFETKEV